MTIYEMTEEYMELLQLAEDPDVDQDVIADTLDALSGEIDDKADGYAKVIRQMEADIVGVKAEETRLSARRKVMENNVRHLKEHLMYAMAAVGKEKIKTELFNFTVRKNAASVVMDEGYIENIPEEYLIQQDPKIDRAKIKADLKAGNNLELLDGIAHLEQSKSLMIK